MKRLVPLALALSAAWVQPREARACSPPSCTPSQLTPGVGVTVPANLPGIHWVPGFSYESGGTVMNDPANLELATTTDPSTSLPFTTMALTNGAQLIVPTQALVVGTTYTITDQASCGGAPAVLSSFTVAASAPFPTALGTVTPEELAVATLSVPTSSGSCTSTVWADQATVDLALAADMMPWIHAIQIETLVDGMSWRARHAAPYPTFTGNDIDRIYHVCATDDLGASTGLEAGTHAITLRAWLPGTFVILESAPVNAALTCDANPPPDVCADNPGLCEAAGDAGTGGGGEDDANGCCSSTAPAPSSLLIALGVFLLLVRSRSANRRQSAP